MATIEDTKPTSTAAGTSGQPGIAAGLQPQIDKAKAFAKSRPWAFGALAAVVGLATLNTLRGKR